MKSIFKEGFILFLPIGIAFFIIKFIFDILDGIPQPIIEAAFGRQITGLGFLIIVAISLLLGLLTATVLGKRAYALIEAGIAKIPVFGGVYTIAKQVITSATGGGEGGPSQVVTVEYPSEGIHSIGFLTKKFPGGNQMVYMPSTPVPNTGFLIIVPPEKVTVLDLSMSDAMRLITSGGVASPDFDLVTG